MRKKLTTKAILITMALLLVFNLGCARGNGSKGESKAQVNQQSKAQQSKQLQSTTKAKATINKNLNQLDKDLNQLDKSDSGADNLNEKDFN